MVRLFSVRENEPLWRNWQTLLTQNQAGNTVPVRVRPAAVAENSLAEAREFF